MRRQHIKIYYPSGVDVVMASGENPSYRVLYSQAERCGRSANIRGQQSSVSVHEDSGSVVVAYSGVNTARSTIRYALGDLNSDAMRITWGPAKTCESVSGRNPKIALLNINDKKTVVMVYVKDNRCYCRLDPVEANESTASDKVAVEQIIDEGTNPSVTVSNDNTLVVAFISNSRAYSRVGVISESRDIKWKSDKNEIADGVVDVDISMNKNKDVVVVAYTKTTALALANGTIHCKVGSVKDDGNIEFGDESAALNGHFPSISINDHGHILMMLQQATLFRNLFIRCGILRERAIQWAVNEATSGGIDFGRNPSVYLMNNNQFVEVHDGFLSKFLFFRTGELK